MTVNGASLAQVLPSIRQLKWQEQEFYGFIHFGINTFYDQEWGDGTENPQKFNPKYLDTDQWAKALKSAGMTAAILTCKHHDGFCLWPTRTTDYSVASSDWLGGYGDIVKKFSRSCGKYGLKFGIYLSPWDRNSPDYGTDHYDDFFVDQLKELLTNYGPIFEVWLDGANGEGNSGKTQTYHWNNYYSIIRHFQPNAAIAVCGPDVRWIGNEGGHVRKNEWSVVPASLRDAEKIASESQTSEDASQVQTMKSTQEDLGSREALKGQSPYVWYPAECNISIRPGWFYHASEDEQVKSADELFDLYLKTVGGNATFLLNVPPNPDGLIAEPDLKVLEALGKKIKKLYKKNKVKRARLTPSSGTINDLTQTDFGTEYWSPQVTDEQPAITLEWEKPIKVHYLGLREWIPGSQRLEETEILVKYDGKDQWQSVANANAIGYQKIFDLHLEEKIKAMQLKFQKYRDLPQIHQIWIS